MVALKYEEMKTLQQLILEECGMFFNDDKAYYLESKLTKLMADMGFDEFESLYNFITGRKDDEMIDNLIDVLTIKETYWFRDKILQDLLETVLLPMWIDELKTGKKQKIRIWSAASSTGQEAYTVAIIISKYLKDNKVLNVDLSDFHIIATDISKSALAIARSGIYDNATMARGLSEAIRDEYFIETKRGWQIHESLRQMVDFRRFNLKSSYKLLGEFDFVLLRYVLIYFIKELKLKILEKISNQLTNNGVLLLGSSELYTDHKDHYKRISMENGGYYIKRGDM